MAGGLLDKLKDLVGIEEVDDEEEVEAEPVSERPERHSDIRSAYPYGASASRPAPREPGGSKDKVISMNPMTKTLNAITSQFNLVVTEPKSFDECPRLVDSLKSRKPIIINLEKVETEVAKKIFDFLSGATYALNGNMQKIANNIFVFVPENVNVSSASDKGSEFGVSGKTPWR